MVAVEESPLARPPKKSLRTFDRFGSVKTHKHNDNEARRRLHRP